MDGNKGKRPLNLGTTSAQQGHSKQQKVAPSNPSPSFPSKTTNVPPQPQNNNNVTTSERKVGQHPHLEQIRKLVKEINEDKWIDPFGPELIFGTKYFKIKEGEKLPTLETVSIGSLTEAVCGAAKATTSNKGLFFNQVLDPSHNSPLDIAFNSVNLLQLLKESKDFTDEWKSHKNTDFEPSIHTFSDTITFIKSFFARNKSTGVGLESVVGHLLAQVIVDAAGTPQNEVHIVYLPLTSKEHIKSIIEGLPKLIQKQEVSPKQFVIKLFELSDTQDKPLPLHLVWMLHKNDLLHFSEFLQCIRSAEEIISVVNRLKAMIATADKSIVDVKELLLYLVGLVFHSIDSSDNPKLKDLSDGTVVAHRTEVASKIISSLSISKINLKDTESIRLYTELISIMRHQGQTTISVRNTIKSFMTKELKNLVTVSSTEAKQTLDSIFQQFNITKDNTPKISLDSWDDSDDATWITILDPFILFFDGPTLMDILGQVARSSQLNWTLCHRILCRYNAVSMEEAPSVLLTMVNQFLQDAMEATSFSLLKACFALAHIVLVMNSFDTKYTSYQDWFNVQFITEKSTVIKSKKTFELFRNTLIQLLPLQLPEYIKLYVRLLPRMATWTTSNVKNSYITKSSLGDYIIPAKTKLYELGEKFMFEEPSAQAPSASYGDVVKSVNSAIEKFASSDKIPEFVVHAFAVQKTWFKNHFLNYLLLPRAPDIVDARSRFIQQLVQEKFIPGDLHKEYQEACLKVQRANQIDMDVEVQPNPAYAPMSTHVNLCRPQPGPVGADSSDITNNIVDKMKGMCQIFIKMVGKPENSTEEIIQTLTNMRQLLWVILALYDNTLHPHTLHTLSSTLVSTFITCDSSTIDPAPEGERWQYSFVEILLCLAGVNTGEPGEFEARRDLIESVVGDIPGTVLPAPASEATLQSAIKLLHHLSSASHKMTTGSFDYVSVVNTAQDKLFSEFPMTNISDQLTALKLCCLYLKHLCANYKTVFVTGHIEPFRLESGGSRSDVVTMPLSLLQVYKYLQGKLYIRGRGIPQDPPDIQEVAIAEVFNLSQAVQKMPGVSALLRDIFEEVDSQLPLRLFIRYEILVNPEKNQDLLTSFQRLDWLQITLQKYQTATYPPKETFLSVVYAAIIQLMSHPSFHDSQMMVMLMTLKKMTSSEMHCLECADGLLSLLKPSAPSPPSSGCNVPSQQMSSIQLLPDKIVEFIQNYFEVFKLLLESKSFFAPDDPAANGKDPTLDNPNVITGIFTELVTKLVTIFKLLPRNSEHILNQFNALHFFKFCILTRAGCCTNLIYGAQHLLVEVPMILYSWIFHWSFIQVDSESTEIPEPFKALTDFVSQSNQIIVKTTAKVSSTSFINGDTMSSWLQAIQKTLSVQKGALQLFAYSLVKIAITKLESEAKGATFQDLQNICQENFGTLLARVDALWNEKNATEFHVAVLVALFSYQCHYTLKGSSPSESQRTFRSLRIMVLKYICLYVQQPDKTLVLVQVFNSIMGKYQDCLELLPALPSMVDYSFTLFNVLFLLREQQIKAIFSHPSAGKPFTILVLSQYVQTIGQSTKEYGLTSKSIQQWISGCASMFGHIQVTGTLLSTLRKQDPALFAKLKK